MALNIFGGPDQSSDIVDLILEDHKSIKELIKTLKEPTQALEDRQVAYDDFAPALVSHAKPEEDTLYKAMKQYKDLRAKGFEGEVEHQLADQMIEEINRTSDEDLWSARVKVLAELVEHHVEEEESELLPAYKKQSSQEERRSLGDEFIQLKTGFLLRGGTDSPHETELTDRQ